MTTNPTATALPPNLPALLQPEGAWSAVFSYHPFDIELKEAKGVYLYDTQGRRYIDASGGPMAVNLGHGDPRMKKAIDDQFDNFAYCHPAMANRPRAQLSEALVRIAPKSLNCVYLASGGSEAVESAIKLARQYHFETGEKGKYKIISCYESYHGMTLATMGLAGNPGYHNAFEPMLPAWPHIAQYSEFKRPEGMDRDAWGIQCAAELEKTIYLENASTVAAFIATPHGSGAEYGVVPPVSYWREIRRICDQYNILLIADEVVTGFGRTGKWFGMDHFGIEPDLLVAAKGISSANMPLAAVLVSDKVNAPFLNGAYFLHGYTNQGHPMACAAGLATLSIIEEDNLLNNVNTLSDQMFGYKEQLLALRTVVDVRGWGLFMALELVECKTRREYFPSNRQAEYLFQAIAFKNGLALYSTLYGPRRSPALRRGLPLMIAPQLNITSAEMDDLMARLVASLKEWEELLLGK